MDHPSPGHDLRTSLFLAVAAVALFVAECLLFHYPLAAGIDVVLLAGAILPPGYVVVAALRRYAKLRLTSIETLALASALGFGFASLLAIQRWTDDLPLDTLYFVLLLSSLVTYTATNEGKLRKWRVDELPRVLLILATVLCLVGICGLPNLQFLADGSIQTRGLFGVDIPFLAGEVHGIRDFHTLRDLHQSAQAWSYHDWTYQLLALLPRSRTVIDIAFAAPVVGYTLLAISIYALAVRLTKSKYIAGVTVAAWFLISGLNGGELGSYTLSPSFVFGSILAVNVLLVLSMLFDEERQSRMWVLASLLAFLLVVLLHTKLTTFLVLIGGVGLIGLLGLRRHAFRGLLVIGACVVASAFLLFQMSSPNPLMPGGDFLIGAPLLGYANHVAAALHTSVSSLNPVSTASHLRWQCILIIPYFVFHFLRFAITEPKVLAAITVFIVFGGNLWKKSNEVVKLLLLMIPLGFLLPVLYSPAWYPLALSFYAPLASLQAAVLVVAVGFSLLRSEQVSRYQRAAMGIVGIICIFGVALNARSVLHGLESKPEIFSTGTVKAMDYLATHAQSGDIIATRRYDLDTTGDESYYWYSALSGRAVVSEGAKYGSLLSAVADTNNEKGLHPVLVAQTLLRSHRAWLDTLYSSHTVPSVQAAISQLHASYILENASKTEHLAIDPNLIADSVFAFQDCTIWRVRQAQP